MGRTKPVARSRSSLSGTARQKYPSVAPLSSFCERRGAKGDRLSNPKTLSARLPTFMTDVHPSRIFDNQTALHVPHHAQHDGTYRIPLGTPLMANWKTLLPARKNGGTTCSSHHDPLLRTCGESLGLRNHLVCRMLRHRTTAYTGGHSVTQGVAHGSTPHAHP